MTLVVGLERRPIREVGLEEDAPVEQRHEIGIRHGERLADQCLPATETLGDRVEVRPFDFDRPERLRKLATANFDRLGLLPLEPTQFGVAGQVSYPAPLVLPGDGRPLSRIGWCTGGAQGYFESAIAAGVDL